jgi:cysteine desulfurase
MKLPLYLDYNATTPVDPRVLEAMMPYFSEKFGNASGSTHPYGWIARDAVNHARKQVASLLECEENEIIFTSGATESINLAIKGVFEAYASKGNEIVTVKTEHKAVLETCSKLESKGAKVTYLDVDKDGLINLKSLESAITDKTVLVAVMAANNETGVMQPLREIAEIVHAKKSVFFCDATQAFGKTTFTVPVSGADLIALSAHKMYGPKGAGALYVKRRDPRVALKALVDGGGQERGLRGGTLNVPGIIGLGMAAEIAKKETQADHQRFQGLVAQLYIGIKTGLSGVHLNGHPDLRLANTLNLRLDGFKAERLLIKIPEVALSLGSACTSANREPSHVLKAMGLSEEECYSSLRISIGKYTTQKDIIETIGAFARAVKDTRGC